MADSSRTEKPTPRRLQKTREEGRFATSREFVGGVQFAAFVALLTAFGPGCLDGLTDTMRRMLIAAFSLQLTPTSVVTALSSAVLPNLTGFAILAACLVGVSLAAQLATTQLGIATAQLMPDLSRLNPVKRLSSLPKQNVPAFLQAVALFPVFCLAVWGVISANLEDLVRLPLADVSTGSTQVLEAIRTLLWRAAFVLLAVGAFDLYRQRRRYIAELKMSPQEIREEHKELEGNPQIKMRIRRIQRDLLRRNMMKEIPNATAVVVNPTHYAVAIRYSLEAAGAPTVVAKGKNYLALRIKQQAMEHEVPIVENAPLAQALYKSVDIGQEIPPNLYKAVAEVLAYIFRLTHGARF